MKHGAAPLVLGRVSFFRRIATVFGVIAFLCSFHLVYVVWLSPVYASLGFTYPESLGWTTVFGYAFGVVPAFALPVRLARPSHFLQWVIYLTMFLPAMLTLSFLRLMPEADVARLQATLLGGMILLLSLNPLRLWKIPRHGLNSRAFTIVLAACIAFLLARVTAVYWGHFQLVAWDRTYEDIRSSGGDLADAAGLSYPINWLSFVFLPLVSAIGLVRRNPAIFLAAFACNLLLYATQGMKHILFESPYIFLMFLLVRRRLDLFGPRFVWSIGSFFILFASCITALDAARSGPAMLLGANVVMRMFATPGLLMGVYQRFLVDHPLTHYSHVTGINWLVHYPYQGPMGLEVGLASTGFTDYNMNAGFWVTDGLAAIGLPGILLISIVAACVFFLLDCISFPQNPAFVSLCLSQYAICVTNVSLFTSMITGGLLIFMLLFWFMPAEICGKWAWTPRRPAPQGRFHSGAPNVQPNA